MIFREVWEIFQQRKMRKVAEEKGVIVGQFAASIGCVPCRYSELLRCYNMRPDVDAQGFSCRENGRFDVFISPSARPDGVSVSVLYPGPRTSFQLVPWQETNPERLRTAIEVNKAIIERGILTDQNYCH